MLKRKFTLGCDVDSVLVVCSVLDANQNVVLEAKAFANNIDGFIECIQWILDAGIKLKDLLVCMEHTGVYSESFCYFLYEKKIKVVVESGAKVKKSFKVTRHKTDEIDSGDIAEYAIRYADRIVAWQPRHSSVEAVKSMLSQRELLVKHQTAEKNALSAYRRKVVQEKLIIRIYEENIRRFESSIKELEEKIESIIASNEYWLSIVMDLRTVCGVKKLLPYNMFVISNGFSMKMEYKKIAAYLRICPYQYRSGTSIRKRAKTPKYGPAIMRKLLYLAARTSCQNNKDFKAYYQRKQLEGKEHNLIMNNVGNKLLKIMCAMINDRKPFIPSYRSVNPILVN